MADLAAVTVRQDEIGKEIQRQWLNFTKDSKERKSKAEYFDRRIAALEALMTEFRQNDEALTEKLDQEHPYFTQDFCGQIEKVYQRYKGKLETQRVELLDARPTTSVQAAAVPLQETKEKMFMVEPPAEELAEPSAEGLATTPANQQEQASYEESVEVKRLKIILASLERLLSRLRQDLDQEFAPARLRSKWEACATYYRQASDQHQTVLCQNYHGDYKAEFFELLEDQFLETAAFFTEDNLGASKASIKPTSQVKLPKIEIPMFDGSNRHWKQFQDIYLQMVHNRDDLSDIEKFFYLKANLSGQASRLIGHLMVTKENYTAAWATLVQRFDNPRVLVTSCLADLIAIPALSSESYAGLRRFHDQARECLLALNNLGVDTTSWDPLVLQMLLPRLDPETRRLYELSLARPRELQSLKEFFSFLESRFQSLEAAGGQSRPAARPGARSTTLLAKEALKEICPKCKGAHRLYKCDAFQQLRDTDRLNHVTQHNLCLNCLSSGHKVAKCQSRTCMKCTRKHHTTLHDAIQQNTANATSLSIRANESSQYVFVATACVTLVNNNNKAVQCRALLDSGSQINLITTRLAKKLELRGTKHELNIAGIGSSFNRSQERINVELQSTITGYKTRLEAFVLPTITGDHPQRKISTSSWNIPHNIRLADPAFNMPNRVDLLLGADLQCQLMSVGQFRPHTDAPLFQNTLLGWVVLGKATTSQTRSDTRFCGITTEEIASLDRQLARFWNQEEMAEERAMTTLERYCENQFKATTKRTSEGRFLVRLPFINQEELGESRTIALQRFLSLEKRLLRHTSLRNQYTDFMKEYEALRHMEEVQEKDIPAKHCFLPHHCVLKPDSSTTKLRVVFDASVKTTTNRSLNDVLMTGPTIQEELFSILVRFRLPTHVFTADISKMYRQIQIGEPDTWYQLIIWREQPSKPLKYYRLRTITYGTTCAPYLAIRCLHELSDRGAKKYPLGAKVLRQDFYVDDVMTGSDNLNEAVKMQTELRQLLKEGGFELKKWCANNSRLVHQIDPADQEKLVKIQGSTEYGIKTLGLTWVPEADHFMFQTSWPQSKRITKRTVTSETAQLFDPLGLVNPVITMAKIFIQELWKLKLDWDAALPLELHNKWTRFRTELSKIQTLQIERHAMITGNQRHLQVHVFSDASEKAYGATAYLRSVNESGEAKICLLCAKSKIAPIKTTTLPRLELCAAKLAIQLASRLRATLSIKVHEWRYWSDSTITLAWIAASTSSLHTFVANRVAYIQRNSEIHQWNHVASKDNPADLASRGLYPAQLLSSHLWYKGPGFLHQPEECWPTTRKNFEGNLPETRNTQAALITTTKEATILDRIPQNNFQRLQEILAFMVRFWRNARAPRESRTTSIKPEPEELELALNIIVKHIQQSHFGNELVALSKGKWVGRDSKLATLNPFLDEQGIIRVGGRLKKSSLPFNTKHPMVLEGSNRLTKELVRSLHIRHLHAGPQALLAIVRQKFWPTRGRRLTQIVTQQCMKCAKAKPVNIHQLMGNLPKERIERARPFLNVGIDFCGPVTIHYTIRGKRPTKTYIAVFVCFTTKAVHLELVSDLSTASFIGALKRFVARRGCPSNIFCDNATNFAGARSELDQLSKLFQERHHNVEIQKECSANGIKWNPIPPRSPHFGGLWEAAVKSAKYHLKRIISAASLTHEELSTVIAEVEAALNSRPIMPLSENPNDLLALTPGHFLIGEPLRSIDTARPTEKDNMSTLKRWELVTRVQHEFWGRWSKEYLQELQTRSKWHKPSVSIKLGSLVLLKEPNLPPLKWTLARVINVIHGDDGGIRVVEVKTTNGIFKRAVHNICPLPPLDNDSEDAEGLTKPDVFLDKRINHKDTTTSQTKETPVPATNHSQGQPQAKIPRISAATVLCLALCILPILAAKPIEVVPFNNTPGVYFNKIGPVQLITDNWKLIVYYDMKTYWAEIYGVKKCVQTLNTICQQLEVGGSSCHAIIDRITHQVEIMEHINDILLKGHTMEKSKGKRSPFDIVGSLTNALFGILDQEYARKIEQEIERVKGDQTHIRNLLKKQTSVIDATANVLQKAEHQINQQFAHVYDLISNITNQLHGTADTSHAFHVLATQTLAIAADCRNLQDTIFDLLTDTQHGKINPLLLTPTQLRQGLSVIRETLLQGTIIPSVHGSEILTLYSLMKTKGRLMKNYLIVTVDIPLISNEQFDMFDIIPFPRRQDDSLVFFDTSSKYLIIDKHQDSYFFVSDQQFSECVIIADGRRLCPQQYPILKRASKIHTCEISLLLQELDPTECEVRKSQLRNWWRPITDKQAWLFSVGEELSFKAVCDDVTTHHTIKGEGILKINAACQIRHPTFAITSPSNRTTRIEAPIIPGKISEDLLQHKIKRLSMHHGIINNTEELNTIKGLVKEIQLSHQEDTRGHFNSIHHFAVSYTNLFIMGALLILYVVLRRRRNNQRPMPAPRTNTPANIEMFQLKDSV